MFQEKESETSKALTTISEMHQDALAELQKLQGETGAKQQSREATPPVSLIIHLILLV